MLAATTARMSRSSLATAMSRSMATRTAPSLRRTLATTSVARSDGPGGKFDRPAPPSLPPKEQREFEKLVKEKQNVLQFNSAEEQFHPDARRKPQPDFDGDTNPQTGEVGGPKKDPLTYEKEWTYGGRATDF